jgi:competence protein ComEC
MKFYKIPFIWLIIPFIFGITTTNIVSISPTYSLFIAGLSFLLLLLAFNAKKIILKTAIQHTLLFASFFMLGNNIMTLDENKTQFSKEIHTKNENHYGIIVESSITKSGYIKYIVQCKNNTKYQPTRHENKKLVFVKIKHTKTPFTDNSTILFHCNFEKIKNLGYPGEFDSEYYWKNKGVYEIGFINNESNIKLVKHSHQKILSPVSFRNNLTEILKSVLTGQELALANALILGERNLLTNETTQGFSDTGAMHILAVSGLHIGILLQILLRIFQLFQKFISKNLATILSLIIVWFYALITGFSPSVVRSVIMFSFLLIGTMKGKENSEINILAFSAFILLSWKPIYIYDVGFQLSYTAMLGIYLFYPFLKNVIISRYKILQLIIEGSMVGIAAQITTVPLTLYYFHQFPNYFILTNIALMAFSFIILLLGILLFSFFWILPLKIILGMLLQKTMTYMLSIVSFFSQLPFAVAKGFMLNKWEVLFIYFSIGLFLSALINKKMKMLYIALFSSLIISSTIFYKRLENNMYYFKYVHREYPDFQIIKSNTSNYFIFPKYTWNSNKTQRIRKDFTTLYPGRNILIPLEKIKGE